MLIGHLLCPLFFYMLLHGLGHLVNAQVAEGLAGLATRSGASGHRGASSSI